MSFPFIKCPFVLITIRIHHQSFPMHQPFSPLSCICLTVCEYHLTLLMRKKLEPISLVSISIGKYDLTVTRIKWHPSPHISNAVSWHKFAFLRKVLNPSTFQCPSLYKPKHSFSMLLSLIKLSFILPFWCWKLALAMPFVIQPSAFIEPSILIVHSAKSLSNAWLPFPRVCLSIIIQENSSPMFLTINDVSYVSLSVFNKPSSSIKRFNLVFFDQNFWFG